MAAGNSAGNIWDGADITATCVVEEEGPIRGTGITWDGSGGLGGDSAPVVGLSGNLPRMPTLSFVVSLSLYLSLYLYLYLSLFPPSHFPFV